MIKTFADKKTAAFFLGPPVKQLPPDIRRRAKDKLDAFDAATHINDLLPAAVQSVGNVAR